ncbi:MAG: hypothetical protein IT530_11265 [Burkholderiales bacterium]|nr:hypothetical protein [Burkholderiales bacterium]
MGEFVRKRQVAHVKLCASRAFVLVTYPTQTHEMLFDAHTRAFRGFGGIPRRVGELMREIESYRGSFITKCALRLSFVQVRFPHAFLGLLWREQSHALSFVEHQMLDEHQANEHLAEADTVT